MQTFATRTTTDGTTSTTSPSSSTVTARAAFAEALIAGAVPTLSAAAVAAMSDPAGISPVLEAAVEIESNRLRRPTTVTLRRGDTLADVGVRDPAMNPATLTTGRRNPHRRYAVADVTVADEAVVFDADPAGLDELPVAHGTVTCYGTVPSGYPTSGSAGWSTTTPGGLSSTLTPVATSPDADGSGFVWQVDNGTAALPADQTLGPTGTTAVYYWTPPGGRRYTVESYLRATGGALVARWELVTNAGTVLGPAFTIAAGTSFARRADPLDDPETAGAVRTAVTLRLRILAGTAATRVEVDAVGFYAGDDRGTLQGRHAGIPDVGGAVVDSTWTGGPRRVNRVEVSGERRAGRVTSARVLVDEGSGYVQAGVAYGGGRLAILLDRTYLAVGVRVLIEETTSGPGGRVWTVEVDPMYVVDATGDVESAAIKWQREAAPGSGTIPVGNYQASSVSLELANDHGIYTPSASAAIDVGHRVEVAVGVRYTNQHPNPRADVNATGYLAGVRLFPATTGGPAGTSVRREVTVTEGTTRFATIPSRIPAAGGTRWRASAWLFAEHSDAEPTTALELWSVDVVGTARHITTRTGGNRAGRWERITAGVVTLPADAVALELRPYASSARGGTLAAEVSAVEAVQVASNGADVEVVEVVPAGVFYSDPWDAPSDSTTVTIEAADRLGRFSDVEVEEPVRTALSVGALLTDLALFYLDLDEDQTAIASSSGSYVIPYAYPSGTLGSYLADLAKATLSTLYLDPLDRLAITPRGLIPQTAAAELRADNALVRYRKPTGVDLTASIVRVTAAPLKAGAAADLWTLPEGGVQIAPGATREILADYSEKPAINAFVTGIVADAAYTLTSAAFHAGHAVLRITNPGAATLTVATATVRGTPLVETPLATRRVHEPSRSRYGARELAVEAQLVQTPAQLDTIADALIDAFRGLDEQGNRRLPDVELTSLGLFHLDLDDRVSVVDPATGIGADYQLTTRELGYESGRLLLSATGREAPSSPFAVADQSIADDIYVAGY